MKYDPPIKVENLRSHFSITLEQEPLGRESVFLTGHSHRVWPDCVVEAQLHAVELAHRYVDLKWKHVFGVVVPHFQGLVARRAGIDKPDLISNDENTHNLVTRVLSCFPWDSRTRFVSTDSEFHSLKRQLYRLQEDGVQVTYVPTADKRTLTDRIVEAITHETSAVLVSTVFFNDGYVLQRVPAIVERAREVGATVVLDAYHHFNVRKLDVDALGRDIFVVAGGYKYGGSGEGAAWMKVPEKCELRPRVTGWFADFGALGAEEYPNPVNYGDVAQRFLGATRDMSGLYRQTEVLEFMYLQGLTVDLLEKTNLHQTAYLIFLHDLFGLQEKGVRLLSSRNDAERGPFIALDLGSAERAHATEKLLWDRFLVLTDTRGKILRIGPAPYNTQRELEYGMEKLNEIATELK